jgi:hypothetical protein
LCAELLLALVLVLVVVVLLLLLRGRVAARWEGREVVVCEELVVSTKSITVVRG